MLLPATRLSSSSFLVHSTKSEVCRLHNSFFTHARSHRKLARCSAKFPMMGHFNDPSKLVVYLNNTKEKLWELIPTSVKQFPWEKARATALHDLRVFVERISIQFFPLICALDVVYSVSRNKELVIPFSLFVGCMITNYFDLIFQEFMNDQKNERATWRLLGVGFLIVVVKVMFSGGKDFLMHAANGGLMQVFWKWYMLHDDENLFKDCLKDSN